MSDSFPRAQLIALAWILFLALATIAHAQFICDVDPWSQTANSGFGAGPGEVRGFGVTLPDVPDECLAGGDAFITGVIVNVTQQGGSSTMPISFVEVRESSTNGPPERNVVASGPGRLIFDVPSFPDFVEDRFPTGPELWSFDTNDDGFIDAPVAPLVFVEGDATPGQFVPYSTNGGSLPCHTGLFGDPINEPCSNGDPNFRSMGVGMEMAAANAILPEFNGQAVVLRTNNPDAAADDRLEFLWNPTIGPGTVPNELDLEIFDADGLVICDRTEVPPGETQSCLLTIDHIAQYLDGRLEIELDENGNITRYDIVLANAFIFADGFESGDTAAWSNSVP